MRKFSDVLEDYLSVRDVLNDDRPDPYLGWSELRKQELQGYKDELNEFFNNETTT